MSASETGPDNKRMLGRRFLPMTMLTGSQE